MRGAGGLQPGGSWPQHGLPVAANQLLPRWRPHWPSQPPSLHIRSLLSQHPPVSKMSPMICSLFTSTFSSVAHSSYVRPWTYSEGPAWQGAQHRRQGGEGRAGAMCAVWQGVCLLRGAVGAKRELCGW